MTQQGQKKWNAILNILLLINKKWRQPLGRAVNKSVTGQTGGRNQVERKRQVAAFSNTSYVAGGNFPTFGVMIPQESGIRAGGLINDN